MARQKPTGRAPKRQPQSSTSSTTTSRPTAPRTQAALILQIVKSLPPQTKQETETGEQHTLDLVFSTSEAQLIQDLKTRSTSTNTSASIVIADSVQGSVDRIVTLTGPSYSSLVSTTLHILTHIHSSVSNLAKAQLLKTLDSIPFSLRLANGTLFITQSLSQLARKLHTVLGKPAPTSTILPSSWALNLPITGVFNTKDSSCNEALLKKSREEFSLYLDKLPR